MTVERKEKLMVTQNEINRINELYKKAKAEGLTPQEAEEQKVLRADYIKAFKENLRGTLDTIKIQNPDGTMIDVKERHEQRMKIENGNPNQKGN